MTTTNSGAGIPGQLYQIRIGAHLDAECSPWLGGMTILNLTGGEAILRGTLADQAALYGVLQTLRNMNVTLLDVRSDHNAQSSKRFRSKG